MKTSIVLLATAAGASALELEPLAQPTKPPGPKGSCRCFPGELCWPSVSDWNSLNKTVGGRLVRAIPPGAVCYDSFEGTPTRDDAKCAEVAAQWTNSSWT